jgi:hypothetical protein
MYFETPWMSEKEVSEYGWMGSAPVIEFTNGVVIIASMDDEVQVVKVTALVLWS